MSLVNKCLSSLANGHPQWKEEDHRRKNALRECYTMYTSGLDIKTDGTTNNTKIRSKLKDVGWYEVYKSTNDWSKVLIPQNTLTSTEM